MTIKDALRGSGLPSADAEVLLSRILGKDRPWLLAHGTDEVSPESWSRFTAWVERRRKHEPVAYIIGEQEFYGRPFTVDKRVLIPRPATEGVVRRALQFLEDGKDAMDEVDSGIVVVAKQIQRAIPSVSRGTTREVATIVDVGTGSGCISVTLALERPDLKVIATDISADALDVARMNAKRHGALDRVTFKEGSGLEPVHDLTEPFLLVSNPPYIPSENEIMMDVRDYEPHVALFGGISGDDVRDQLEKEAEAHPFCVGWIIEGRSVIV